MSARDGGGQGDGWLGYDREAAPVDSASGDSTPTGQDQLDETAGPWLRHDLRPASHDGAGAEAAPRDGAGAEAAPRDGAGSGPRPGAGGREASEGREASSPWLAPELSVPEDRPPARDVADTAVPPTMAAEESTGPVRVADTDPTNAGPGDPQDAPTGPNRHTRRSEPDEERGDEPAGGLAVLGAAVKEFAIVVGMALVLSFVVKTWLLQAFYIPSGSMEDTLQVNDRVIVSKLTPGPFDLRRGDIIVFGDPGDWVEAPVEQQHGTAMTLLRDAMMFVGLLPDDAENHLIKRVIGLPGDHVQCCDAGGRLTVNGQPVKEPYLKPGVAPSDQNFDITVPRGRVWVMGDNRSGSADSRFHDAPSDDGSLGSVDERLIVGRAVALVWPLDHLTWLSNPSSTFRKVPAPSSDTSGTGTPADGGGGGTQAPTTGGGTVDGGEGG